MNTILNQVNDSAVQDVINKFLQSIEITTNEEHKNAVDAISNLMIRIRKGEEGLRGILKLLSAAVQEYEKGLDFPDHGPEEMIRFLMEQHGHKQKDLADVAPVSVISEILSGKRSLNKGQIERLSKKYHVSPAVFF